MLLGSQYLVPIILSDVFYGRLVHLHADDFSARSFLLPSTKPSKSYVSWQRKSVGKFNQNDDSGISINSQRQTVDLSILFGNGYVGSGTNASPYFTPHAPHASSVPQKLAEHTVSQTDLSM